MKRLAMLLLFVSLPVMAGEGRTRGMHTLVDSGAADEPLDCAAVYLDASCDQEPPDIGCYLSENTCCCLLCADWGGWCHCADCQIIPSSQESTSALGKALVDGEFKVFAAGREMTFTYDMVKGWVRDDGQVFQQSGNGFVKPDAPQEAKDRTCSVPSDD